MICWRRKWLPLQYSCLKNSMNREPGGLQSMVSQSVSHDWATNCFTFTSDKWEDILCSWIVRINTVKVIILPKAMSNQCNSYKNTYDIFQRASKNNSTVRMETQKILNNQSNLDREEESWRNHTPWFWTVLKNHSKQNSIVLAQIQTNRSVKKNREPRAIPTFTWLINLWQKKRNKNVQCRKESLFKQWHWENCPVIMEKNQTGLLSHIKHKSKF